MAKPQTGLSLVVNEQFVLIVKLALAKFDGNVAHTQRFLTQPNYKLGDVPLKMMVSGRGKIVLDLLQGPS